MLANQMAENIHSSFIVNFKSEKIAWKICGVKNYGLMSVLAGSSCSKPLEYHDSPHYLNP